MPIRMIPRSGERRSLATRAKLSSRAWARTAALALALAALALASSPARAQTPQAPVHLTAAERAAALKTIRAEIQQRYVFPERRAAIVARLDQAARAGRYDTDDAALFADRISQDMSDAGHDHHLWMRVDRAAYAASLAPPTSDAGEEAFWRRQAIRNHHGLVETRLLPGNIRYLRVAEFAWVRDETGLAYDEAMRFLRDGDAVIIDVRGNPGGTHAAVRYLISHFLDEDTLEMTFFEGNKPPEQSRALAHVPAGRFKGKPLYVLIDGNVGSAAEAFAYDVQQFKVGELVGAQTAGAANNNKLLPVAPAFTLSVSYGRPLSPISNSNWEGVGVQPTIAAPPAQALEVAELRALDRLASAPGASPEARASYAWARAGVEARLHPAAPTAAQLKALVGHYGKGEIVLRDGSLWLAWPPHPLLHLVPMNADGLFAAEGMEEHMRVRLTGKALELLQVEEMKPRVFPRR